MTHDQNQSGLPRRSVVATVGIAGAGALGLAACSSSDTATTDTAAAPSTTATDSATSSAPATSESAAPSTTAAAPAGTSVPVADIPVGGGHIDDAGKFVVTQPTAGEFKAFSSICTHQGCPVNAVQNNVIICPCHDSHFNATTGAVISGEASSPLPAKTVTVSGANVIVS